MQKMTNNELEKRDISQIKVASLYESVTQDKFFGPLYEDVTEGKISDIIQTLKETKTDFVFRGFWRWNPCPESCSQLPSEERSFCKLKSGYSYEHLREQINKVKGKISDVIFCGAVPAQILHKKVVWNPKTGDEVIYPDTWSMALDPSKPGWDLPVSKEKFQCEFAHTHLWIPEGVDCDCESPSCNSYKPDTAFAYFPDITNPEYQDLLLSWAYKQIDCGADAIWIDMLFTQTTKLLVIAKESGEDYLNHPAITESFEAACKIVDEIHSYGESEGKYIYVGSWGAAASSLPYTCDDEAHPNLDFITLTPSPKEVENKVLDGDTWDLRLKFVREKFGDDIPIFSFLDWATTSDTPLGKFSQYLEPEEQGEFLRATDDFFSRRGVNFVYPVHGGTMGVDATTLSWQDVCYTAPYGEEKCGFKVYDSLAPEFQTYETIKELAQKKATPTTTPTPTATPTPTVTPTPTITPTPTATPRPPVEYAKCLFPRIFTQNPAPRILTKDPIPRISCIMRI